MEKDIKVNPKLVNLLWITKVQKKQEQTQNAQQFQEEYLSQTHLTLSRSKHVAYQLELLSPVEQQHLADCRHCQARIRAFQRNIHPTPSHLFLYKLGLASESVKIGIKNHLDNECSECNEKINGFLGTLANKLTTVLTKSKFYLDYICNQLDKNLIGENFNIDNKELNSVGSFAPSSSQYKVNEILNMTAKNDKLTLVVKQSPGNQLRLAITSSDPIIKYVYIEVHGQSDSTVIKEATELKPTSNGAFGEKFLRNFDQLIQQLGNNINVLPPIPIDEATYKELNSKISES